MDYYIGIDIGTTSTKAVAFSTNGETIASESAGYKIYHPQLNYSEQDPDEIFAAVVKTINKITSTLLPHKPIFISFSAAMHSIMAVSISGESLTKMIIWADNRATKIADELNKTGKGSEFYSTTGVPIHPMSPLCKLLWLKENEYQIFSKAYKFIGIKEYIFYRLIGQYVIDTSLASATGLLNIHTLKWDEKILQHVAINETNLSELVSAQTVFYSKTSLLNIPPGTPIVIGASDGVLSNVGTGADKPGSIAVTIGTSGAVRMMADAPRTDEANYNFCYHLFKDQYIIGAPTNNGAIVLQWLKENVLVTDESYEQLFSAASTIPAGADGMIFLPYLLGERAPVWNANAKGVFFGITIHHTKAHFIKAAIEGVIFTLYSIGKNLLNKRKDIEAIYASGGFAQSKLWLQVLADVFNIKVVITGSVQSAALGAVIIGIEALGIKDKIIPQIISTHEPMEQNHRAYKQVYKKFERLYDKLKDEMN